MNYLNYTSKEMFSSTDLIRKSKKVFDNLKNNEIEKAIILRDGKPSFILIDFEKYEKIMNEYMELKNKTKPIKEEFLQQSNQTPLESASLKEEEINEEKYKKALEEIEKLENCQNENTLEDIESLEIKIEDDFEDNKDAALKDFWK